LGGLLSQASTYLGPSRRKGALQIDWDSQFVCGFSLTNSKNWARYVPLAHEYGENLPEAQTWELMKPVLETLPVIGHGLKFEIRNLRALERKGRGPRIDLNVTGDTIIQSYVLSKYQRHGLKGLVKAVFDYDQPEITSLFPEAKKKDLEALRFNVLDLSDPKVKDYACEDAIWPLRLNEYLLPHVMSQRALMYELEMRILPVLCDMEDAGHAVDWAALREAYAVGLPFEMEMQVAAKAMLSQMAGEDLSALNLASTPQMREVLYSKIGLKTHRRTDKGEMSTDAIALERLSREHPAVKKVLEVREVHNLTNRMDKWLTEYSGDNDDRVHASFNQIVVGSGRFSANDPAVQQCPKTWRWSVFPQVDPWNDDHWAEVTDNATFGKHYWAGNFRYFFVANDGSYVLNLDCCVAPDTRGLTTKLRWLAAGEVSVGDELIGFDEEPGRKSRLKRSVVERTKRVVRDGYRITLDDGSSLVASGDHLWVSTGTTQGPRITPTAFGAGSKTYIPSGKQKWVRTRDLVPGKSRLSKWIDPWNDLNGQEALDAAWLGGVIDGEGWIFGTTVGFGQKPGLVLDEFRRVCKVLDLPTGSDYENLNGVIRTYFRGNQTALRALALSRPVRLAPRSPELWEGRVAGGSRGTARLAQVVAVEPLGNIGTVALQTSTRTFIAEGFLSHNSQIERPTVDQG